MRDGFEEHTASQEEYGQSREFATKPCLPELRWIVCVLSRSAQARLTRDP
jgi:hypothetical protein